MIKNEYRIRVYRPINVLVWVFWHQYSPKWPSFITFLYNWKSCRTSIVCEILIWKLFRTYLFWLNMTPNRIKLYKINNIVVIHNIQTYEIMKLWYFPYFPYFGGIRLWDPITRVGMFLTFFDQNHINDTIDTLHIDNYHKLL